MSVAQSAVVTPYVRLAKPHNFFPFDLFHCGGAKGYLPTDLESELSYVSDHCMVPPYPWGQVVYHDFIVKNLITHGVPGAFAEFGIGQGGTSVFLARLAKKYHRKFLAVDSFEGLPPPDKCKDNHYFLEGDYRPLPGRDNYEAFMEYKSAFDVDDVIYVEKAFFRDVVIPAELDKFAFVHLDSDLYESVYDSLEKVWDCLSIGVCIAVDDFFHHAQGPARAVADFFRKRVAEAEPPLMFLVPTYAVLVVKGRSACLRMQDSLDEQQEGVAAQVPLMYSPRALDGNFYSFVLVRGCEAFLRATEASVRRITEACARAAKSGNNDETLDALARVRANAESFQAFLHYPDVGARSGNDILRYLLPLEDLFDITQGSLCGMPGEERRRIEIGI